MTKLISIIIPNYNGRELLEKNLPKVIEAVKFADIPHEIIVVDDGSRQEVKSEKLKVKSYQEKIKIIGNYGDNHGFSSAVNLGVKEARGDIIVLLNNDIEPEKDFLRYLMPHFSDRKIFAVGCLDKSIEKGEKVLRGRGLGIFKRGFLIHWRGEIDKQNTLWVSCGSGAFRRDLWLKIGGLDSLYNPFYWEDIDLSYRAQKLGYKILFERKSKVIHWHEEGVIKKKFSPFMIKKISYRNQFFFVWKNITDKKMLYSHFLWLPYHFLKAIINFDIAFFAGFFLALLKLPLVMKKRYEFKKFFPKNDQEVLAGPLA